MRKIFCKYALVMLMFIGITCLFSSCGSMRVYVNQDATYSRKNPITINQSSDDKSGTLGELQFLLLSNGYKLMSYGAAKKAFHLDSELSRWSYQYKDGIL
ncbi:MAG: hypothetical protein LBP56_04855 [Odoribacteraceae bacterium]|jgi:hypothetical protein|nr:hypothetical protein [Odoribacteraceae bacterium]